MEFIYIDSDYKAYTEPGDGRTKIETDAFDGMSKTFIEGHRFVPFGCEWVREDGEVFSGEMVTAWQPYHEMEKAQLEYEIEQYKAQLAEAAAAYESGVNSI